jgi:antitoxin (DNA-binding transcriptional repressor) of toxin-antitoxin stability system
MSTLTLEEAGGQLARLVQQISESGEEIVLTDGDKPVARLVAVVPAPEPARPRREPGSAKGLILYMADDFDGPLDDFAEYQ